MARTHHQGEKDHVIEEDSDPWGQACDCVDIESVEHVVCREVRDSAVQHLESLIKLSEPALAGI